MAMDFKPVNNREGSILSALWRDILFKDKHIMNSLDIFIDRYVRDQNGAAARVKNLKRKTRSSLTKNIVAPDMTWKTFLDLVFNLLKVVKIDVTVQLTFANGHKSLHTVTAENKNIKTDGGPEDDKHKNTSTSDNENISPDTK